MASVYWERLIRRVLELSTANDWDTAVTEWEIADCEEDDTLNRFLTGKVEKLGHEQVLRLARTF